jgi:DNA-binding IscR family transcriptional regulator
MLDEGIYTSVSEISDAENISKSYVSRILRLALLAPHNLMTQIPRCI